MTSGTSGGTTVAPVQRAQRRAVEAGVTVLPVRATGAAGAPFTTRLSEYAAGEFIRWREGEPDALRRLVRRVTPVLWHVARAYRLDRATAEDVVQTTWLALARGADSVRNPAAILGWLTTTTRREAWRVAKEFGREDNAEPELLDAIVPPAPGVDGAVIADAAAQDLRRQVARLSPRCQRLLRVIAFDDRPGYSTLSAELGMPHGSIGPTRRRCLDQLRELLGQTLD
jgi:RNA polymerase sigma factor (sigma-70 family)